MIHLEADSGAYKIIWICDDALVVYLGRERKGINWRSNVQSIPCSSDVVFSHYAILDDLPPRPRLFALTDHVEQATLYDGDDAIALARRLGSRDTIVEILVPHYSTPKR